VWAAFIPSLPCSGASLSILFVLVALMAAAHVWRFDRLATGGTLVSMLIVGGWGLAADMSSVSLGIFVTQLVVLVLAVLLQLLWIASSLKGDLKSSLPAAPQQPSESVVPLASSAGQREGVLTSVLSFQRPNAHPAYVPVPGAEPSLSSVVDHDSLMFQGLFERAGVRARAQSREKSM
jgi:hypothetical protein